MRLSTSLVLTRGALPRLLVKILFGKAAEAAVFNDTLVVIVGDHGESFGEEGGGYFHGGSVWKPNLVPMMLIPHAAFSRNTHKMERTSALKIWRFYATSFTL